MVKIPGLDDLKKMGSDLMDSAKAVKFGEMVDKVKSGLDSVGKKVPVEVTNEVLKAAFTGMFTTLKELADAQAQQTAALKKAEKQLEDLVRIVETYQNPPVTVELNKEDTKPNE